MNPVKKFRSGVPQVLRFQVSAFIGTAVFWLLNEGAVHGLTNIIKWEFRAIPLVTVAWMLSYFVSIWFQFVLNSTLVYGPSDSYWKGLFACYTGYTTALLASVPINMGLVQYVGLDSSQAWLGTLTMTGITNYFFVTWLCGGTGEEDIRGYGKGE
ncbi:unnamed protein product [Prorocentrum cordatum]|uniref:Uncharacterized protein n=1 Tax=Prorocentrum cordatum TaxID=2364126 RepID=A0ABN9PG28_9DINO|nr:unnamed protein product [Polarella glacialis]